ncbi:hypothetical protein GALL_411860 [mine drainage metagenome]|uniref:Uncharacterized protein n=1 Tax=mine drainage metagenome TaxID=410659 RepID=A0A1J5Q1D0_9ZZZZ
MSINSISAVHSSPKPTTSQGTAFRSAMEQSMSIVAARLGMSVSDLRAHMQFGKTLADVAAEVGVPQSSLTGVIKESLVRSGPQRTGNQTDALANRIANHRIADSDRTAVLGVKGAEGAQGNLGVAAGQAPTGASGADKDGDNDAS